MRTSKPTKHDLNLTFEKDSLCIINKHVTPATRLQESTNPVKCTKITVGTKNILNDDFHQFLQKKIK